MLWMKRRKVPVVIIRSDPMSERMLAECFNGGKRSPLYRGFLELVREMKEQEFKMAGDPRISTEVKARTVDRVDVLNEVVLQLDSHIERAEKYIESLVEESKGKA